MKSIVAIFSAVCLFVAAGLISPVQAQDQDARSEAIMAYNNARELAQNRQFVDAIEMYREARSLAASPDCEGCEDIVQFVDQQLPRVYYNRAGVAFEEFRSQRSEEAAMRAIEYFQEAQAAGEEFGDQEVARTARSVVPQLYYNLSLLQYSQGDNDGAIASLDQAIELNPNYTLAYYQKALTVKQAGGDLEEVMRWFDRAAEVGQAAGDTQNANRARTRGGEELLYHAVLEKDANRMSRALNLLQRAQQYIPNDPNVHYRMAEVYNNLGNHNQAVASANRALELASGGVAEMARFHFELGIAYKGLENKERACQSFENAAYGEFQEPARYELEYELKCEGYAAR